MYILPLSRNSDTENLRIQKLWKKMFTNISLYIYVSYRVFHALIQQHTTSLANTCKSANTAKYFLLTSYKLTVLILLALTSLSLTWHICSKTVSQKRK